MKRFDGVIFDLGGVVLDSPLLAFYAFEAEHGLPDQLINRLVVEGGPAGAWQRLERGELPMDAFIEHFSAEARALGYGLDAAALMARLESATAIRPEVTEFIAELRSQGYRTAALTNNWSSADQASKVDQLRPLFDAVIESFRVGVRKPEKAIYPLGLSALGLEAHRVIFVDDIGFNLKPARALGMHTLKALSATSLVQDLRAALGGD